MMNIIEKGYKSFWKGNLSNPYNVDTYRNKEWERGFNKAYFEQLERVKKYENRRRGKGVLRQSNR